MSKNNVLALKGKLPELNFEQPFSKYQDEPYCSYFKIYGFKELNGLFERHYFGSLDLCGYRIATHIWLPANPKANVLLVHGLFDHVGLFLHAVAALLKDNYTVVAFDLPEHGLSSGKYGELSSFSVYASVVEGCITHTSEQLPGQWHAVGQSTGSAALMKHLLFDQNHRISKLVLLAPLIYPRSWRSIKFLYHLLSPFLHRVRRGFEVNSHDTAFCHFLEKEDPLQERYVAVRWVGAMMKWARDFKTAKINTMPVLTIQGTEDTTVDFRYNLQLLAQKYTNMQIANIEGAMHHLPCEAQKWRDQVFSTMLDFLN